MKAIGQCEKTAQILTVRTKQHLYGACNIQSSCMWQQEGDLCISRVTASLLTEGHFDD